MSNLNTAPKKLKSLLILCVVAAIFSIGVTLLVYSSTRNAAQVVGKDTVPQIIAAKQIKATLASAHSNAMNAMVTKEKLGGKFWNDYRSDLNALHLELIDASENINYGDEERIPIYSILSNISAYEYTVGGSVSSSADVSVDQFMEANRLMQQKILPAGSALNKANLSQLNSTYDRYVKNIGIVKAVMVVVGFVFIVILIATQVYLFRKTHRILNVGLLLATILFSATLVYSASALNSIERNLHLAKSEAFESLNALWSARAEAYNANALESLYLLHNKTGIVQTADTINFDLAATRMSSDPKAALDGEKSEGYLGDALNNITFQGEELAVKTALQHWIKYVEIDKQMRNLEYDSKHNEAIALNVGDAEGQSDYMFTKFDASLEDSISINQKQFDTNINSAFKTLNIFPYILSVSLVLIIASCILGMKPRIDEYRV